MKANAWKSDFFRTTEVRGHTLQNAVFTRDNGIGIGEKNHDKVFRIFSRLNKRVDYTSNADAQADTGKGSGLAFIRKIVEQHGGTIVFTSEQGKGSMPYFTFPLART